MATEVVAIRGENAGAVSSTLVNTILGGLFHKAAQRLNTGFAFGAKAVKDVRTVAIVNTAS